VKPETVIAWHRQGFRLYWKWKSRVRHGRPSVPTEVQNLIQNMSSANPHWGAPRLHGELLKLGIRLAQATVAKYMVRHRKPPSQTWRTFLENHVKELVSTDFFVVPTATFRLLFVFLVLGSPLSFPARAHEIPTRGGTCSMTQLIPAQRVILDTQVCSRAATGKISSTDSADFCACLSGGFVHCISPLVVVELLYGLYAGNDTHFRLNQDKLRHLYQASNALVFLPLPGQFLARNSDR
jgi:hypothetical protein